MTGLHTYNNARIFIKVACQICRVMIPGFLPEMHIMVLKTHRNLKGEVRLTFSSTFPSQQDIAYSISCSKAETEIDLLQDGGKIIKKKNIDHHCSRTIPNFCHLPYPPTFSLVYL